MRTRRILCAGFCDTHGGQETAEVRDVRRTDGGRGLPRKRMDGASPGRA